MNMALNKSLPMDARRQEFPTATARSQRYALARAGSLLLRLRVLLPAFIVIVTGRIMNLIVITVNHGRMPILVTNKVHAVYPLLADRFKVSYFIHGYGTLLWIFSVGDVLIICGLIALLALLYYHRREVFKCKS